MATELVLPVVSVQVAAQIYVVRGSNGTPTVAAVPSAGIEVLEITPESQITVNGDSALVFGANWATKLREAESFSMTVILYDAIFWSLTIPIVNLQAGMNDSRGCIDTPSDGDGKPSARNRHGAGMVDVIVSFFHAVYEVSVTSNKDMHTATVHHHCDNMMQVAVVLSCSGGCRVVLQFRIHNWCQDQALCSTTNLGISESTQVPTYWSN